MSSFWGMALVAWVPCLLFGGGLLYLAARFIRAFERRNTARSELAAVQDRLLRLEESVADIASSVDRLAEGQSFTTRVLAGRSQAALPEAGVGSRAEPETSLGG